MNIKMHMLKFLLDNFMCLELLMIIMVACVPVLSIYMNTFLTYVYFIFKKKKYE
jgi:hypothetical protein